MEEVCGLRAKTIFRSICVFLAANCAMSATSDFGRGVRTRGDRGFKPGLFTMYSRHDNNFFAVLSDVDEDNAQDGGLHSIFTSVMGEDDGFTPVRGKQSKRQRIRSGGQSGCFDPPQEDVELFDNDFDDLNADQKLSLVLSKLSINENRVNSIQNKMDTMLNMKPVLLLSKK